MKRVRASAAAAQFQAVRHPEPIDHRVGHSKLRVSIQGLATAIGQKRKRENESGRSGDADVSIAASTSRAIPKRRTLEVSQPVPAMRLGLCCAFYEQQIKFRTTTATHLLTLSKPQQLEKLRNLCLQNVAALSKALQFCSTNGIGSFRINSEILPVKTHPQVGYEIEEIPGFADIIDGFVQCGKFAKQHNIRTVFHPDQFVVLNSPRPGVIKNSVAELIYQATVAQWVGADVINIHGGGAYGDKNTALSRLRDTLRSLPKFVLSKLTLENDDRVFTPSDLLPVCCDVGIPFVYDVHHHRCNPDMLSVGKATALAMATWNREPLFHVSSPKEGWNGPKPSRHHDFINISDMPDCWRGLAVTVEIEAKAKEVAIKKLQKDLIARPH